MGFFNRAAPLFGRFADRWDAEDIARVVRWLAPYVGPDGRILDLGGGTGALAAKLADAFRRPVVVLDPTPEMLAYLPDRPDVTGVRGIAEDMPLRCATSGGVTACAANAPRRAASPTASWGR
ncbi:MAG: methyltransferase domain-containing protein [Coriobacteriia bacterium]|nr:methyltransferase domain-containing protein [Coriobacteriia bacterium]